MAMGTFPVLNDGKKVADSPTPLPLLSRAFSPYIRGCVNPESRRGSRTAGGGNHTALQRDGEEIFALFSSEE